MRAVGAVVLALLVVSGCGRAPSAAENVLAGGAVTPTSVDLPFPAPTARATVNDDVPDDGSAGSDESRDDESQSPADGATNGDDGAAGADLQDDEPADNADASDEPTPEPTASPTPRPTPEPTATPRPTAEPTSTPAPAPVATSTPAPTATPVPTPTEEPTPEATPEPTGPNGIEIGCRVSETSIELDTVVLFEILISPSAPPIRFEFNHGDGTTGRGLRSAVRYAAPGTYVATARWTFAGEAGIIPCGQVEVRGIGSGSFQPGDYVGLDEAAASALADGRGFDVRVVRRDEERFAGTTDFRTDRINFEIDGGLVTLVSIG